MKQSNILSIFPKWTCFGTEADKAYETHPKYQMMGQSRTEHYRSLPLQFRSDGCDEYTVKKFMVQEVMEEADEAGGRSGAEKRNIAIGIADWWIMDESEREKFLSSAHCAKCGSTSINEAAGYTVAGGEGMPILLNGSCSKCGSPVTRVCE